MVIKNPYKNYFCLNKMKYISLGCCCETSFVLERIFGMCEKYPFDWLSIHDFNDVIKAIESDFKNFNITEKREVDWKTIDKNDVLSYPQIGDYKIHVIHELDQKTLDRRVERFRNTMKGNEPVMFVLKTHLTDLSCVHPYSPYMPKDSVERLEKAIQMHRKENYTIIVVNESIYPKDAIIWSKDDKKTKVVITHINGSSEQGYDRGLVIVPCFYRFNPKCFDQWKNILSLTGDH